MNQVAVIFEKHTKKLLACIEFNHFMASCNIVKIPSVEVVVTVKSDEQFYVENNEWYVNEKLLYKK